MNKVHEWYCVQIRTGPRWGGGKSSLFHYKTRAEDNAFQRAENPH